MNLIDYVHEKECYNKWDQTWTPSFSPRCPCFGPQVEVGITYKNLQEGSVFHNEPKLKIRFFRNKDWGKDFKVRCAADKHKIVGDVVAKIEAEMAAAVDAIATADAIAPADEVTVTTADTV